MNDTELLNRRISTLEDDISSIKESMDKLVERLGNPIQLPETKIDVKKDSLPENLSLKIDYILKHFNFNKVHSVMTMLNWTWASTYGVPNKNDLIHWAKDLLVKAASERTIIASGGFKATYEDDYDGDPYLGLEFIIEECTGFTDDDDDDDDDDDLV